jgi:hypothetical protein
MDLKKIYSSKTVKICVVVIGAMIYGLVIFKLGMVAGYDKADFSHSLGENYRDIFTNQPPSLGEKINDNSFTDANGASGKIIKINDPLLYIEEPNDGEKVVSTDQTTTIRMFREQIPFSRLKTDEFVVVVGDPDGDGTIGAKLIRVVPPPPQRPAAPKTK